LGRRLGFFVYASARRAWTESREEYSTLRGGSDFEERAADSRAGAFTPQILSASSNMAKGWLYYLLMEFVVNLKTAWMQGAFERKQSFRKFASPTPLTRTGFVIGDIKPENILLDRDVR
jgi:hypothetical protein